MLAVPSIPAFLTFSGLFISLFFEVFILINFLDRRHLIARESARTATRLPSVSVIVPCYNEEKTVGKTIDSLLALDYPKDKLKILVIDDGSKDGTLAALEAYENNPQVSVHSKVNGGKYTALNYGLALVETEMVGCLDADSFADSQALKNIVRYFDDEKVMAVTPAVVVHEPQNLLQKLQRIEYAWGELLRKTLSFMGAVYVTPGPLSIFRTQVFRDLGGYKHAHYTEDFEIAIRMQSHHYRIENAHDAYVYTVAPRTLHALYKQRLRWTYGFLNNIIDYRFMLFKKKYGNIGIYVLPMAILSVFTAIFFFMVIISSLIGKLITAFVKIDTIGVSFPSPHVDWLFFNANAQLFITIVTIGLSAFILLTARKLVGGKLRIDRELVYYMALYGLLAPLWLTGALAHTIFRKDISWR